VGHGKFAVTAGFNPALGDQPKPGAGRLTIR
jgi:hypothetical protein